MSYYEDEIYHSGYLDGYYAGMELYHADDSELTEEEKARRKKRKRARAVALGVGIPVGAAAVGAGIALPLALRKRKARTPKAWRKLKRVEAYNTITPNGWDFKRNVPKYPFGNYDPSETKYRRKLHNRYTVWDHDQKKEADIPYDYFESPIKKRYRERKEFVDAAKAARREWDQAWANYRAMHRH